MTQEDKDYYGGQMIRIGEAYKKLLGNTKPKSKPEDKRRLKSAKLIRYKSW